MPNPFVPMTVRAACAANGITSFSHGASNAARGTKGIQSYENDKFSLFVQERWFSDGDFGHSAAR